MTELTHENFAAEAEQTQIPVLIDFFSEKCSPCKAMGVVFDGLAEQYHSRCKFCKVDVDALPEGRLKTTIAAYKTASPGALRQKH